MRVLTFGWEFPPHITGGLGTACYGLIKGLSKFDDIEVIFVVPKAYGDESQQAAKLVAAADVSIDYGKKVVESQINKVDYYEVTSNIVPYTKPDEFWKLANLKHTKDTRYIATNSVGKIDFTGKYGSSLFDEVFNYAIVAQIIARQNTFDLIHAHDWLSFPAGIAVKRATGKPLLIHVHATDFDRGGGYVNPKVYSIEREGMEMADCIITVSKLTKQIVIDKYGVDPNKIVTLYNAVEPAKPDVQKVFKKVKNEKIVTFLGRITLQKGPEYFIDAANLVLKRLSNVRFVMAGSGDMLPAMIAKVNDLGIAKHFVFTGFLKDDEVHAMYQMSDVYVMSSVSEPFGITTLEAMINRVPVIISKQSGVSEIVRHAIKIDYFDIEALADTIHALIKYPSLSNTLKKNIVADAGQYTWEKTAAQLRDIYTDTLNKFQHDK